MKRLLVLTCVCFLFFAKNSLAQQKPNIIFILADDMGYGDVKSLNPQSKLNTINIDNLAANGMRFTDAHSSSALCSPTRYGILTGRYDFRSTLQNGVLWSYDKPIIAASRMTIASLLKKNGYNTAAIGKWHLGLNWAKDDKGNIDYSQPVGGGPADLGFDYFYGITASLDIPPYVYIHNDKITATSIGHTEGTSANEQDFWREGPIGNDFKHEEVLSNLTNKAVEYINDASKKHQPFFLYFALTAPHTPMLPAKEFLGKSHTNAYGDFVLMVDAEVGKIMKAVKNSGIEKNTLIVFTSDNGVTPASNMPQMEQLGHYSSYVFRGHKADIFEGGHRIPFVISWPGKIEKNTVSNTTICLTDFMATCASIVHDKLPSNAGEDSYDLTPLLCKNSSETYQRSSLVSHSNNGSFSIRQGNWKLELCPGSGGWSYPVPKKARALKLPPVQLYNLKQDISEQHNLAAKHPDIVKKLTSLMQSCIDNGRSTEGVAEMNDVPVKMIK